MPVSGKRKRTQDEPSDIAIAHPAPPNLQHRPAPTTDNEPVTRRATRQTPVPPPILPASLPRPVRSEPASAPPQLPQSRRRGRPVKKKDVIPEVPPAAPKQTSADQSTPTVPTVAQPSSSSSTVLPRVSDTVAPPWSTPRQPQETTDPPTQEPRVTVTRPPAAAASMMAVESHPPLQPKQVMSTPRPVNGLVAPEITYQVPQPQSQPWTRTLMRPSPPTSLPPSLQSPQFHHQLAPLTSTPIPIPNVPHTSTRPQYQTSSPAQHQYHDAQRKEDKTTGGKLAPCPDRNIDKVVLGNICFRTWYPSYYGKELLGEASAGQAGKGGSTQSGANGSKMSGGSAKDETDGKGASKRGGIDMPLLDRLYVCPFCFKYSKELVAWLGHVHYCETHGGGIPPGRKIYTHPRGRRSVMKPVPDVRRGPGKRTSSGIKQVEEVVTDLGEWSVWEVDGEQDTLFCQNLSLFAKLFLDTKSVFFDVKGFNYFLLVYTPPPPASPPAAPVPMNPAAPGGGVTVASPSRPPQVVGFFSKEKMSWDNNNLACILVFPPWQRKGLGALLMGVSYEISRREQILGGPEKPISELGKKGYRRFWAGEIARWLLGVGGIAAPLSGGADEYQMVVDLNECSQGTWITVEDCLATLREMDFILDAGMGPPKKRSKPPPVEDEPMPDQDGAVAEGEEEVIPQVHRARIDKEAVRRWIAANNVSLERACDPHGFVEGYAMKEDTPVDMEE